MAKILIAEDEESIRDLIVLTLTLFHHQVTATTDGVSVVQAAEKESFDLIMLDVHMPQATGLEAAEQIRTLSLHKKTPLLFLSGDYLPATHLTNHYLLIKPFPIEKLLTQLKTIFHASRHSD